MQIRKSGSRNLNIYFFKKLGCLLLTATFIKQKAFKVKSVGENVSLRTSVNPAVKC